MGESGWELRGEDWGDGGGIGDLGKRTGDGSWENWIGTGGLGVSIWGLGVDTGSWRVRIGGWVWELRRSKVGIGGLGVRTGTWGLWWLEVGIGGLDMGIGGQGIGIGDGIG